MNTLNIENKIIKRDGSVVEYDGSKITKAVLKAIENVSQENVETNYKLAEEISAAVENVIKWKFVSIDDNIENINIEEIQNIVEQQMMSMGHFDIGRSFIVHREEQKQKRNTRLRPDITAIEDYVFTSKYARYIPELNRRETFEETCTRVKDMFIKQYPNIEDDIEWAFERVLDKQCLPSMRAMQFGGVPVERHNARLYNCSFSLCDRVDFFKESMYLLLCGVGVGFSVEFEHVEKIPKLAQSLDKHDVKHHIIADSIEGWADAISELVDSYIKGTYVEFSYAEIRPFGAAISSGGRAPGHVALKNSIEKCRLVLDGALGRQLKPIECYDMIMHSADAVLAGGVRRSACICLFSQDDGEMINAKRDNWFETNPQRARSNNSVKLIRKDVTKAQFMRVFQKQKEWGEPGFFFANDLNHGTNPCCEIGLDPTLETEDGLVTGWQFCNLTEINGSKLVNVDAFREAVTAATIIGTCQAGFTSFPYLGSVTEDICKRDALLGVSITGMMEHPDVALDPDTQKMMALYAVGVNDKMSKKININQAKRITCVKPAGTTSLVLGTASGIHPRHARRYFRRVQASIADPVYKHFKAANPHMCEASVYSANQTDDVISFCIESSPDAILRKDVSALDLLGHVLNTQNNWVKYGNTVDMDGLNHNVSNTVTVAEGDWDKVSEFIWNNRSDFTGVTTLADFGDKMYQQAPHEEVTTNGDEKTWGDTISKFNKVDYTELKEQEDVTTLNKEIACAGGKCDI